jgi:hypothetical protein
MFRYFLGLLMTLFQLHGLHTVKQLLINWKECDNKMARPVLWQNPITFMEGLRKPTKTFSQGSRHLGRDSSPRHPEYEVGVQPLDREFRLLFEVS